MEDRNFTLWDLVIGALVGVFVFGLIGGVVLWLVARLITWITGDIPELGEPAGTLLASVIVVGSAVAGVFSRRRDRLAKARRSRDTP